MSNDWRLAAACRGMPADMFFPARGPGMDTNKVVARAKAVCATCPVTAQCLDDGLAQIAERPVPGIWGGTTPSERRIIKRRRRLRVVAE